MVNIASWKGLTWRSEVKTYCGGDDGGTKRIFEGGGKDNEILVRSLCYQEL